MVIQISINKVPSRTTGDIITDCDDFRGSVQSHRFGKTSSSLWFCIGLGRASGEKKLAFLTSDESHVKADKQTMDLDIRSDQTVDDHLIVDVPWMCVR